MCPADFCDSGPESSRQERITPLLRNLHWLRSPERIDYKLAVLVFRCLNSLAPRYLSKHIQRVAESNRRCLRSSSLSDEHGLPPCFSGRRKSCLEQSATRRHISFDSRCFPKAPQNISVLTFIHCLTFDSSVHRLVV